MSLKAAVTVHRPREEVERLWQNRALGPSRIERANATVRFADAPGDRGTEIHVDMERHVRSGRLGELVAKLAGALPLAKAKDELRHFKQLVETGEIPRSDATPEGERAERKLHQRPARPLDESELRKAGSR